MGIAAKSLHGARVCILPRPENNFKPYALRHPALVAVSALLLTAKLVALGAIGLMPLPAELSTITTSRIVQLTNQERAEQGLGQLAINQALSNAAQQKARDMLDHDYFAHISPAGVTPWFWMNKVGYTYKIAGENLAIDFVEAEDVVTAWMASPTHRDNILRADYVETGVGVLTGEFEGATSTVVVHMFGLPAEATAAAPPSVSPATLAATAAAPAAEVVPAAAPAAPPAPRLTVPSAARENALFSIGGTAGTSVLLYVNSQLRATVTLPESGTLEHEIAIDDLPDGELIIRAQARRGNGPLSDLSSPQVLIKDTVGPALPEAPVVLIASPATDSPAALALLRADDFTNLTITAGEEELSFVPGDVVVIPLNAAAANFSFTDGRGNATSLPERHLLPSFATEHDTSYLEPPARFSQVVRRMTAVTMVVILLLLILAILIRIQVQHPRMIMHALFVLALATTLFVL